MYMASAFSTGSGSKLDVTRLKLRITRTACVWNSMPRLPVAIILIRSKVPHLPKMADTQRPRAGLWLDKVVERKDNMRFCWFLVANVPLFLTTYYIESDVVVPQQESRACGYMGMLRFAGPWERLLRWMTFRSLRCFRSKEVSK